MSEEGKVLTWQDVVQKLNAAGVLQNGSEKYWDEGKSVGYHYGWPRKFIELWIDTGGIEIADDNRDDDYDYYIKFTLEEWPFAVAKLKDLLK
jgi:hypothetical protein